MEDRIVARCRDCAHVTTAIHAADGTLTCPGYGGCPKCGGRLAEIDGVERSSTAADQVTRETPLAAMLLRALLDAGGELPQDELIATNGRSPYLNRDAIRRLAESGTVERDARDGTWYVRLATAERVEPTSSSGDYNEAD